LRTLWGKFAPRRLHAVPRLERWDTPDGDFLDIARLDAPAGRPRLIVLHGLEGSPRSHYARSLLNEAARRGWAADVIVFRSCGQELNRTLRFYHSGETTDLDFVVRTLVAREPSRPIGLVGCSLGGNVLLKWLGEQGNGVPAQVVAAATISVPYDLARGSRHIDRGFARVYQAHFLRSLRRKAQAKRHHHPDKMLSAEVIDRPRSLYEFDDIVTAPLHGFRDAADYYKRSSAIRWIDRVRKPTLLLSSVDDPFLPRDVLDEVRAIARGNAALHLEFVARGGHAGFVSGTLPWRPFYYAEWRTTEFIAEQLGERVAGMRAAR
jgi:predicted alpha/beta-fold hydrolase